MKVTYVSHACLLIDTGTTLIATDPWFDGPAFCDQWNVFPKPVDSEVVSNASVFLISHPHEDHLHEPTLRRLCRTSKRVFYPFYWYPETITWLRSLGLGEVSEARSGKAYSIDRDTRVTFIGAPGQNSIIVIEAGGEVLVNVNDALHSEANSIIDVYVRHLKRRWPRIDTVFCGFGGASYYPNALHASGKDDRAIARLREQLFIHNFCRIVQGLAPRTAVPFAADFVLLSPHQRWINDVRFGREEIPAYYRRHFSGHGHTEIHAMYPGDFLMNGRLERNSPYRAQLQNGRLDHLIDAQYPNEVSAFRSADRATVTSLDRWTSRLAAHLESQVKFHPRRALDALRFSLRFRELSDAGWFDVEWTGTRFAVTISEAPSPVSMATIETTTSVLETSIENDWGGDALMIGYGCDINVLDVINSGKTRICVSLLTRYPRPKSYALRYPLRTLDYLHQSAPMLIARTKHTLRSRLFGKATENVIASPHWLTGDVKAIRNASRLPVLDNESTV
jgi:Beta-lactamase superfamily domain